MDGNDEMQGYWSGGPSRVRFKHAPGAFPPEDLAKATEVLEDFRAECHKTYFAFNGLLNGRLVILERYKEILNYADILTGPEGPGPERRIAAAPTLPDGEEKPGKSTTAVLTQGQILASFAKGGEVEDMQNKALLVMLYQRWDEWYRHRIAKELGLEKNKVRCSLMGEVRQLRNVVIHDNGVVPEGFSAPLLSRIWSGIPPGFLVITDEMVTALTEQLNAVLVEVG